MVIPPKLGATAAIAGTAFLIGGTALHPMSANPHDPVAAFTEYASDRFWVASHLGQFVGVALVTIGLIAFTDRLRNQATEWLARLGVYFAVAGVAAAAVLQAIDGIALKVMVDRWASAPANLKDTAFHAAFAVRQMEIGMAAYLAILFGAAVFMIAVADALSAGARNWLGWLGAAGGAGTMASGLLMAFTGFSATAMNVSMVSSMAVAVWVVVMGTMIGKQRLHAGPSDR